MIAFYLIINLPQPHFLAYSIRFFQVLPVNLQVYSQVLAKVLTLSRFWTCLQMAMAMKFDHAVNFNAVVNFAICSQVRNVLIHV